MSDQQPNEASGNARRGSTVLARFGMATLMVVAAIAGTLVVMDMTRPRPAELMIEELRHPRLEVCASIADADAGVVQTAAQGLSPVEAAAWKDFVDVSLPELFRSLGAKKLCSSAQKLAGVALWPVKREEVLSACEHVADATDQLQRVRHDNAELQQNWDRSRVGIEQLAEEVEEVRAEKERHLLLTGTLTQKLEPTVYEVTVHNVHGSDEYIPRGSSVLLMTTTTEYTSQGGLAVAVKRQGSRAVTLKNGFTDTWPLFTELPPGTIKAAEERLEDAEEALRKARLAGGDSLGPALTDDEELEATQRNALQRLRDLATTPSTAK